MTGLESIAVVACVAFGLRYVMKPFESYEHYKHNDPPAVRKAGNALGWVIAVGLGLLATWLVGALGVMP